MIRQSYNQLEWLQFPLFQKFPELKHGILLPTASLQPDQILSYYGLTEKLVTTTQIHGNKILEIKQFTPKESLFADALSTSVNGLPLGIKHADCQAAIFYDPIHKTVANVHAGWRGMTENIYYQTIQHMHTLYNSNPADLLVGISPSLEPQQAEFLNYKTELPQDFWPYRISEFHFNLWAIARMQLEKAGVLPQHIECAQLGTYENSKDFHSYRRDKTTKRHLTFVAILMD